MFAEKIPAIFSIFYSDEIKFVSVNDTRNAVVSPSETKNFANLISVKYYE